MLVIPSLLCTAASNVSLNDFQSKGSPLKVFKTIFGKFTPWFLLESLRISIGFVISGWQSRIFVTSVLLFSGSYWVLFFFQMFHKFIAIYHYFYVLSLSSVASFSVSSSLSNKYSQSISESSFLSLSTKISLFALLTCNLLCLNWFLFTFSYAMIYVFLLQLYSLTTTKNVLDTFNWFSKNIFFQILPIILIYFN